MTIDADVHVITSEIRQAVKGREVEIIKALGIPYRDGKSHINCPHWDHLDRDPSWRFDERTGRAICTCGSHSIFDVLMKVERIAFGVAKIRAAEILGRQDLIRVRSGSKLYQRHDAHSLLNPPSDNRDDQLPFIYLGCRLGIEPADVPPPQTPVVGIESLEYFDPPASPRARPKLIGSWPCAVFGTIAADGRSHAQRVYLSSDGWLIHRLGRLARGGKSPRCLTTRPGKKRPPFCKACRSSCDRSRASRRAGWATRPVQEAVFTSPRSRT